MGSGTMSDTKLDMMLALALNAPGDFAEIGVYRGDTFKRITAYARSHGRRAHAFDSFHGMDDPGPHDGDGYPKGRFDIGGVDVFHAIMQQAGFGPAEYETHVGFVPHCLTHNGPFAFVYLDLDHYWPTRMAIWWAWRRLSIGGIMAFDDYMDKEELASRAIKESLQLVMIYGKYKQVGEVENDQLVIQKVAA